MPQIPNRIQSRKPAKKFVHVMTRLRYICPNCGAIHHWDSISGCHAKCGYMDELIREDLYKRGQG